MSNDLDEAERLFEQAGDYCEDTKEDREMHRQSLGRGLSALVRHLRSHPAPPPSPSDEPAGAGASDEETACPACGRKPANLEGLCPLCPATDKELERAEMRSYESGIDPWLRQRKIRRALYDLGKRHQASADAATIAGLRADLDRIHRAINNRAPHDDLADCIIEWIEEAKNPSPEPII